MDSKRVAELNAAYGQSVRGVVIQTGTAVLYGQPFQYYDLVTDNGGKIVRLYTPK